MIYKKTGHGGDIYGKSVVCDFSANVNPLGTPDSVRRAVIDSALRVQNYPDPCCRALRDKIAEYEGVSEDCIMCSNGAAELIFSFCAAVKPQKVLELAPTFSEYSEAVISVGGKVERYVLSKENDFALTEDFLKYIDGGQWDVLFLCSPNNPTGRLIEPRLLENILNICRQKKIRLFLDECFLELSDDGGKNSMKRFLDAFPELFILKAFTKNYAMAGLRLGYGLSGDKALLESMSKTTQVWNVSVPAQEAGIAAIGEREFLARAKKLILEQRSYLSQELTKLGFYVCPSSANYILFYTQKPIYDALAQRGILVRSCANYHGLEQGWYRIAVRLKEENELLISALECILGE